MELSINEKKEIIDFLKEFTDYGETEKRLVVESCGNEVNLSESSIEHISLLEGKINDAIKGANAFIYGLDVNKLENELQKYISQCKELEEKFKASGKSATEFVSRYTYFEAVAKEIDSMSVGDKFKKAFKPIMLTLLVCGISALLATNIFIFLGTKVFTSASFAISASVMSYVITVLNGLVASCIVGLKKLKKAGLITDSKNSEETVKEAEEEPEQKLSKLATMWSTIKNVITFKKLRDKLKVTPEDTGAAIKELDKLADDIENYKDEDGNITLSEKSPIRKLADKFKNLKADKKAAEGEAEKESKSLKDKIKGFFKKDKDEKEVVEAAIEKAFYESFIF